MAPLSLHACVGGGRGGGLTLQCHFYAAQERREKREERRREKREDGRVTAQPPAKRAVAVRVDLLKEHFSRAGFSPRPKDREHRLRGASGVDCAACHVVATAIVNRGGVTGAASITCLQLQWADHPGARQIARHERVDQVGELVVGEFERVGRAAAVALAVGAAAKLREKVLHVFLTFLSNRGVVIVERVGGWRV